MGVHWLGSQTVDGAALSDLDGVKFSEVDQNTILGTLGPIVVDG